MDHLRLVRAHTAPATFLLLVTGYFAGGGQGLLVALGLLIIGITIHFASFGGNSVMDYYADLADPSKAHHPLVAGRIKFASAVATIHWLQLVAALGLIYFANGDPRALTFAFLFVVFGWWYNAYYSKTSVNAWMPISACWACLALYASSIGGRADWLFAGYVFATTWFQIDWEGRLKDLGTDEPSLMKALGARIEGGRFVPDRSLAYSVILQLVQFVALGALVVHADAPVWGVVGVCVVVMVVTGAWLSVGRKHSRGRDLAVMGLHEVAAAYAAVFALVGNLSWVLLMVGVAWFVSLNAFLWGTRIAPRV